MKKIISLLVLACFIAANTGCYGSFALTKKVYKWNGSLGDKWLDSLVMWVLYIIPVYGVSVFIDAVVFNVIEFYTSKNPMAFNSTTEIHKTVQSKGKVYDIAIGNKKITIVEVKGPDAGKSISVVNRESNWILIGDGKETVVATSSQNPLNMVNLFYPNGKVETKQLALGN